MIYVIEFWHRPQKCNAKYGRSTDTIPDASDIGTDKFVAKGSVFCVIGSNEELLISGRVWNKIFLIILDDFTLLNSTTWFLMYLRKALEVYIPANMIRNMGKWSKNIAISAPDLTEWVMMYFFLIIVSLLQFLSLPAWTISEDSHGLCISPWPLSILKIWACLGLTQ